MTKNTTSIEEEMGEEVMRIARKLGINAIDLAGELGNLSQLNKKKALSTQRAELREKIEEALGEDEDIKEVHDFFSCKTPDGEVCTDCKSYPIPPSDKAYGYAGGRINGRNELRQEIRDVLNTFH